MAGPDAYPPTPNTAPGLNSRISRRQAEDTARQIGEGAQAGHQRYVLELAHFDQVQREARGWNQPALHPARRAHEHDFGPLPGHKFASDRQRRDDMSASPAAGD